VGKTTLIEGFSPRLFIKILAKAY